MVVPVVAETVKVMLLVEQIETGPVGVTVATGAGTILTATTPELSLHPEELVTTNL